MRRALRVASKLADVASRVVEKHPKLAAMTMIAKGVDTMLDEFRPGPWDVFDGQQELYLGDLKGTVFATLNARYKPRVVSQAESDVALSFELDHMEFGFVRSPGYLAGPYVPILAKEEEVWEILAKALWKALGPRIRVGRNANKAPVFLADPLDGALSSGRAQEILDDLRQYRKNGYKRAVLLYGESGTGKSYMIRWIAGQLGGLTLRVHARDLARSESLLEALMMMRPTALLIDDICRLGDPSEIMDCFESVKASSELVLATANKLSALDPAILRPGRFDDTIEISDLGDDVRQVLFLSIPESIREQAKTLPMAYLNELKIRVNVLGPERAIEELLELAKRRKRIAAGTMDEDENEKNENAFTATEDQNNKMEEE